MSDYRNDAFWMARALALAAQGLTTTTPNPRVGCVLVRDGEVVGEGFHQRAGEAHAEVHALAAAGDRARGATAYVTLEPCSHQGRTPPCADALIKAGVSRVVTAMEDPNPQVAGRGLARLEAAGIDTRSGVLAADAEALNVGFLKRMRTGHPWLTLKLAASLDGATALANGDSQWITGEQARAHVQHGRARSCAILTGVGTVLSDDPSLNVRLDNTERQPARIVLDSNLRTPANARLLSLDGNTWLLHGPNAPQAQRDALTKAGAHLAEMPLNDAKQLDLAAVIHWLGKQSFNEVWIEAGATLAAGLLDGGWVDEVRLYQAPVLLGSSIRPLYATALDKLSDAQRFNVIERRSLGDDLLWTLRPRLKSPGATLT
ncbi:bifunctional diaminohydroxyphosphoribosylaminopyrimidine deaminase/5-amino-6-(5-phosphoribosylamino)uracil reductase RibD [Saccharospirillum mangrovi]|uniref:bifunctional diaminohydroxyphosphoribosylaminopyrimidine deaminase/5-amino-6-(5-phosphoribosylamino)uracil reductase RibD n=1 Tax=Saccharospirillum mangrovi TaxID=2161747 RepID=UPI001E3CC3DB|nr:bifunctional diaminohydroxyphosphoribosylaminopyrimidine deaminase/5-amino-6-(5-phosphoribosylamino)uracil reductase RibD [Saccharospirillum mangrovi]